MLASLLARSSAYGVRGADRYGAWRTALEELRADWAQGQRPQPAHLREYVRRVPPEQQAEALEDLTVLHLDLSWTVGRRTLLETYFNAFRSEFPTWNDPAAAPAALIEDEFLARYAFPHGDAPELDEYARRFPGRADALRLLRARLLGAGRYVRLQKLGQGAAGEVWRAYDRRLRRHVAVKQPCGQLRQDTDALRRFAQEAQDAARLQHPGIVGVYELDEEDDTGPYWVMPLVEGATLAERIQDFHCASDERTPREQRLLRRELLQALRTACQAVAYAHARGVLHRDLKPGNILLGEFGQAAVVDWQGEVVGTPEYMPPEQLDGQADARSDVFGLGAVLYEILTGRPPHAWGEGPRPADWPDLVRQARIAPPRRLRAEIPRALEAVTMKALARDPAERYAGAAELARDLDQFLAGEPVSARLESRLAAAWRRLGAALLRDLP